jgi:hypothetical protein
MPHEDIIAELDEGAKMFNILLLKTDLTMSIYFSVPAAGWWILERRKGKTSSGFIGDWKIVVLF